MVLRLADGDAKDGAGRDSHPTAVVLDGAVLQSTPTGGHRAGHSGHKRRKGSKLHLAVDTPGHLLAVRVTPADVDERAEVAALAADVQAATGDRVELAYVDQGYAGEAAHGAAAAHRIALKVVRLPGAKRGFVLPADRALDHPPARQRRRFRRLARDYERRPATLAGLHYLAFACVLLAGAAKLFDLVHNTV